MMTTAFLRLLLVAAFAVVLGIGALSPIDAAPSTLGPTPTPDSLPPAGGIAPGDVHGVTPNELPPASGVAPGDVRGVTPAELPPSSGIGPGDVHTLTPVEPTGRRSALAVEAQAMLCCGLDDRVRVTGTTAYPYRAIAHLGLYDSLGGFVGHCTGGFIGPNVLVTAAHCLYDPAVFGGWTSGVLVTPGKNGASNPYGQQWASAIYAPAQWRVNQSGL